MEFQVLRPLFEGSGDVLEVGCGRGEFTRFLSFASRSVTAIDVDSALAEGQLKDISNAKVLCLDALNSNLPASSFDAIVMYRTLHFLPDVPGFFAEAHRMLKPFGGRLVVVTSPMFILKDVGQVFDSFCDRTFSVQLRDYWTPLVASNFAAYCDPERPAAGVSSQIPGFSSFERLHLEHEEQIDLLDLESHILRSTVARQFVEDEGADAFQDRVRQLQEVLLEQHGHEHSDLLFERVLVTKCVSFHVEIHTI
jgi:SAM-dependent methyltransferase